MGHSGSPNSASVEEGTVALHSSSPRLDFSRTPHPPLQPLLRPLSSLAVHGHGSGRMTARLCTLPSLAVRAMLLLLQPKAAEPPEKSSGSSGSLGAPGRDFCPDPKASGFSWVFPDGSIHIEPGRKGLEM